MESRRNQQSSLATSLVSVLYPFLACLFTSKVGEQDSSIVVRAHAHIYLHVVADVVVVVVADLFFFPPEQTVRVDDHHRQRQAEFGHNQQHKGRHHLIEIAQPDGHDNENFGQQHENLVGDSGPVEALSVQVRRQHVQDNAAIDDAPEQARDGFVFNVEKDAKLDKQKKVQCEIEEMVEAAVVVVFGCIIIRRLMLLGVFLLLLRLFQRDRNERDSQFGLLFSGIVHDAVGV